MSNQEEIAKTINRYMAVFEEAALPFFLFDVEDGPDSVCTSIYANRLARASYMPPDALGKPLSSAHPLQRDLILGAHRQKTVKTHSVRIKRLAQSLQVLVVPDVDGFVSVILVNMDNLVTADGGVREREAAFLIDRDELIVSCTLNVTERKVENVETLKGSVMKPEYEDLLDYRSRVGLFLDNMTLPAEVSERYLPENLEREFYRGNVSFSEYYFAVIRETGHEGFIRMDCKVIRRPSDNAIIAYFHNRNGIERYADRAALYPVAKYDFDFVGLLFVHSGISFAVDYTQRELTGELMESTDRFIFYSDHDEQVREYFRRTSEKLANGNKVEDIVRQNSVECICKHLYENPTYSTTFEAVGNDGRDHLKCVRYAYADRENGVISMSRSDITDVVEEERREQERLSEALQSAERANTAKTEFLSTMSHEIRTPMNVILGMTELAHRDIADPKQVEEHLSSIDASSNYLMMLINNVLDMSKLESGEFELHVEPYDYHEFQNYLHSMVGALCEQRGVTLVEHMNGEQHPIMTDKLRFNQVMFNILSNAVKFSPKGGSVLFSCDNKIADGRMSCTFEVTDSGIGMSEEFQAKLFRPFTQEDNGVMYATQGTGLGLSLSKGIIDKMGGTISCKSKRGVGTTFRVHLEFPLADEHFADSSMLVTEEKVDLTGVKILLVEDHPVNRLLAKRLLEDRGACVTEAENGVLGLQAFSESETDFFDIVLMDIRMPVMDGLEATRAIRELDRPDAKRVPIVAMTANAYDSDRQASLDAGMDEHLSKPIEPQKLYRVIASFVGERAGGNADDTGRDGAVSAEAETSLAAAVGAPEGSDAKLMSFFGFAVFCVENDSFRLKYCSQNIPSWVGRTQEELRLLVASDSHGGIYPPDAPKATQLIREGLHNELVPIELTFRAEHINGSLVWLHSMVYRLGEEDGNPLILALYRNLDEQFGQYRDVLNEADRGVMVSDPDTCEILFANRELMRLFEVADDDYRGRKCYELFMGKTKMCSFCNIREALVEGTQRDRIVVDGKTFARTSTPVNWEGRPAVAEYLRDVTEEEAETRSLHRELDELYCLLAEVSSFALRIDLTDDTYKVLSERNFGSTALKDEPSYAKMLENGRVFVHSEDRSLFDEMMSLDALKAAYSRGEQKLELNHRQLDHDGEWRKACTTVVFLPSDASGHLCALSTTRIVV